MMFKIILGWIMLFPTFNDSILAQKFRPQTAVSIKGENFYINGKITLKAKNYEGMRLEGLLPNSRMVQGIFDDANPETRHYWQYPDGTTWDPERNTREFVEAMKDWREHGLLAFTLNLQGGNPFGYGASQPWINTAFKSDGSLDPAYMTRLEKIIREADRLGMVIILGYFYFGQDQHLKDEKAVLNGVRRATEWIIGKGFRNVIIEINNECDINDIVRGNHVAPYDHAILDSKRVHELINLAQSIQKGKNRLPVTTSFIGGALPTEAVMAVSDFLLLHGNGVGKPEKINEMVQTIRGNKKYKGVPIVFNEDDHFDFDRPLNNFLAATREHASWGYFDYRMKDEGFDEGYQSVPVNWKISSERKKGFFGLLKEMTH